MLDQNIRSINGKTIILPRYNTDLFKMGSLPDPNPYAQSAVKLFPLGTKMYEGERVFRYCLNGAGTLAIAAPLQNAPAVHAEQDDDIVVGAASAIGDTTVTLTSTANLDGTPNNVANNFADGYLVVNDEAGEGQLYRIKSNEALSTTDNAVFTLYDPLTVALTTSSQCGLIKNLYNGVIVTAAVLTGMCVGVPLLGVTAAYYFWSQVGGPAPVVAHAAIALGTWAIVGTTAGKADPAAAVTTEVIIGYPLTPAVADTETFICYLTLET